MSKNMHFTSIWIIYLTLAFTMMMACKLDKKNVVPLTDAQGKTVDYINHYTIHFTDGTSYDMDEKNTDKIMYLVRHAEKDTTNPVDPPLSTEGLARATKLAKIFDQTTLDAIFSTMTNRTLYTVDSLTDLKDMVILPYDVKQFKQLSKDLNESLTIHKSLVVGHSNTIPVMANYLSNSQAFNRIFEENEYDNLLVVLQQDTSKTLLQLKY